MRSMSDRVRRGLRGLCLAQEPFTAWDGLRQPGQPWSPSFGGGVVLEPIVYYVRSGPVCTTNHSPQTDRGPARLGGARIRVWWIGGPAS